MKRYQSVEEYLEDAGTWREALLRLRKILLTTNLEETLKWSLPCYTHHGKNVVGIAAFKSYCGLWFFQGALLSDPEQVLVNAQEGKTKAMRQWRFTSAAEIKVRPIKAYVKEAVGLHDAGREIKPTRNHTVDMPTQLQAALDKNRRAKSSFAKLSPGKQREYAEYIASAKREETKLKRIAKILPMMMDGVGLNDKYR